MEANFDNVAAIRALRETHTTDHATNLLLWKFVVTPFREALTHDCIAKPKTQVSL